MVMAHCARSKLPTSSSLARASGPLRRPCVLVRAQQQPPREGGADWDGAWNSFKRQIRSQVEVKDEPPAGRRTAGGRRAAPRRVLSDSGSRWAQGGAGPRSEGERIRRAERVLLDLWTGEDFLKAGGVLTILVLVIMVANY